MQIVGVLGAGAMGTGIAQVALMHGHPVILVDNDHAALERAKTNMRHAIQREVEKGRAGPEAIAYTLETTDRLDALRPSALVIEAIVERIGAKHDAFRALSGIVADDCVLATNTSSLSIAAIASATTHPERVLGVHFFNPAPILPLVEIVPWLGTAPSVTRETKALVDSWKKTTVIASDTPGFIVNRVARPFYGEALRVADEGIADFSTIDAAMRELGGFRMGPFELMDFIGLDINLAVTRSIFEALGFDPRYRPSLTQQRLVEAGMLGRKTKQGFFDYRGATREPEPLIDRELGERVFDRILSMLINEAIDAVHWRVASPADIDLAVTKGVNYPKGLLAWGDERGLDHVLEALVTLQTEYGEDRYRPSVLLKRMVRDGGRFTT
ncbi:MAG TPA: 3-hydroxyacyl-CoA dehydrogenase NAD-binding domain-containing protein [Gemmatimonadaceae bacterium]|jgi:3-hydroxybutyryl-CoA dehydrogenase|nr:3-hydroxyacyl-CoA dehydrogenase NAD-binding domain-containing protein [Gemmatimonadaceae bacterium]